MHLLKPPIATEEKVRDYASVEIYKLRALATCYPAVKDQLEPIIKFCERVQRRFQTEPAFAACRRANSVENVVWFAGAEKIKKEVLKQAIALVKATGEDVPDGFFARFKPPVDRTAELRSVDELIADLQQQLTAAKKKRETLLEEAGMAHIPQKTLYMREYARKRRQQEKERKANV